MERPLAPSTTEMIEPAALEAPYEDRAGDPSASLVDAVLSFDVLPGAQRATWRQYVRYGAQVSQRADSARPLLGVVGLLAGDGAAGARRVVYLARGQPKVCLDEMAHVLNHAEDLRSGLRSARWRTRTCRNS